MREEQDIKQWFEHEVTGVLDDLYGAALRLAKNPADAEDLVGEAVARAFGNLHTLNDRQAFRGWIFRILSNCFITECRKRKTRAEMSLNGDDASDDGEFWLFDKLHQPFLLWWGNPEQEFLNSLLRDDLIKALDGLPENFRIVLVLAEVEGFNYQDIAGILEVPVGTVRSRLSRARSLLQKALWQHAKDRGITTEPTKDLNRQDTL
ncbi:MAG: sigma-70 family RNA polymerase sigma factor [Gammaproteobacteria bacterium]|nr:sigma-70 family RNA polymerase sigma factor [Gammaproteobacteria bacterium]